MQKKQAPRVGIGFNPYGKTYGRYGAHKYAKLKQHGYAGADINLSDTDAEPYRLDAAAATCRMHTEGEAARRAGITISQVHGPWRWPPQDGTAEQRAERLEKMKRAVTLTAALGCRHLVIHPLMPCGIEDLTSGEEQTTWGINVAFFRELAAFAADRDVVICLENMPMPRFSLAKPEDVCRLAEAVRSPHLKLCLDTGHVAVFPELSAGDAVRRLGDFLAVLHLHDNQGDWDAHLPPGQGRIDWADFFAALTEVDFDGVLSLETAPSGGYDDARFEEESRRLCQRLCEMVNNV